jgi:AcrR family transcriptional regulator
LKKLSDPARRRLRKDGRMTRERILTAAIELMAEGGRSAVSMVAVACRAGVTRGTVYHHFGSQGGLLGAARDGIADTMLKLSDRTFPFQNPYGLALRLAVDDPSLVRSRIYRLLEEGPLADARTVKLLKLMTDMNEAGELGPGMDPVSVALITVSLDFAGAMALQLGRDAEERRRLTRNLSDCWREIFARGIAAAGAELDQQRRTSAKRPRPAGGPRR